MARADARRRLIVNADDFGRSSAINEAVIRAHREGILTSASLMVNEPAFDEAVALARQHPGLAVGLHLTLVCGHASQRPELIRGLVNARQEFSSNPVVAGLRYFLQRGLREPLRQEIRAQFRKFGGTGLRLDHVNGHLHMHLHPTVFKILIKDAEVLDFRRFRLTRDGFWMNAGLARGRWVYRFTHAMIYGWLSAGARRPLGQRGIRHTKRVLGLLQDSRVDEEFILKLLPLLPEGDSELYSHPSLDMFRHEFDALISPRVKAAVAEQGIQLICYQDL